MPKHEAAPTDPLAPMAQRAPGDPRLMATCLVEEYLLLGYDDEALLALFRDPFYQGIHHLYRQYGEAGIRGLIAEVRDAPPAEEMQP